MQAHSVGLSPQALTPSAHRDSASQSELPRGHVVMDMNETDPLQSHVICTPGAASVIKTYSPNLMVHPLMRQTPSPTSSDQSSSDDGAEAVAARIIDMLPRLHVLVIGPGLGRDPLMQATIARVIKAARKQNMPVVLDADALQAVQSWPDLVRGYPLAVLTPNVVEFGRLCKALGIEEEVEREVKKAAAGGEEGGKETARVEALARALEGVTVVQKGFHDFISDGKTTLTVDLTGGKKRSGGQGDTLTGSIATFLGWRKAYLEGLWDHGGELKEGDLVRLACFGGCAVTRVSLFSQAVVATGRRRSSVYTVMSSQVLPDDGQREANTRAGGPRVPVQGRALLAAAFSQPSAPRDKEKHDADDVLLGMLPKRLQQEGPQPAGQRPHGRGARVLPRSVRGG